MTFSSTTDETQKSLLVGSFAHAEESAAKATENKEIYLSALVVVHNEEKRLAASLERLSFADEIVVVLDRCTDRSKEIATSFQAKCIEGHWPLEGVRRNAGIAACSGKWVLEIDADEHVPVALFPLVLKAIHETVFSVYPLRIDNYVGERLVREGWGAHFGTSQKSVLFLKTAKTWGEQSIHPAITFSGRQGPPLEVPLQHYVDENISDMIQRFDRYTTARATDLRVGGIPETLGHNIRRLFSRFFKCYIMRRGYREKSYGLLIALLAALYPLVSYLKATCEKTSLTAPSDSK